MHLSILRPTRLFFTLAILTILLPCAHAQVVPTHGGGNPKAPAPRWELFAGYSIMDPKGTFYPIQPDGSVLPVSFKVEKRGTLENAARYFTRSFGLELQSGQHDLMANTGFLSSGSSNSGILTLESGPVYRWPGVHLTPFVHALGGAAYIDGPDHEPYTWGIIFGGGNGLDWNFGCHFGMRIFQADYEFLHVDSGLSHGTLAAHNFTWGDRENINAIRVSSGLIYRTASVWGPATGCGPPLPVALVCKAKPEMLFPGEPVSFTAEAEGLNPKLNASYFWTGANVSSNGPNATVSTASSAPGKYTVRATVTEGNKPGQTAECEASYTVRRFDPPTLTCAAGPMTIRSDQTSNVLLTAISPQNRPLTYACTSAGGKVEMNGNMATFRPLPGQSGPVAINCTATDDKGQAAGCDTEVTIQPPPPLPRVKPLCVIDFSKDKLRPTRVDNEAKACLDDVSLDLQHDPDSNLVIVGEETADEAATSPATAAQRAVNTKQYLTTEKGIDPSRITVVTGSEGTRGVEQYIAPAGSHFNSDVPGTTPVDEQTVKPAVRKPLAIRTPKPTAKKPTAAPTAIKKPPTDAAKLPRLLDGP